MPFAFPGQSIVGRNGRRVPVSVGGGGASDAILMSSRTVQPGYGAATGSNGTTDLDSNTRSSHFNDAGVSVTKVKLLLAGWYARSSALPVEVDAPNSVTYVQSIEYPAGTFSADVTTIVAPGDNAPSAEIALSVPIPAFAQFWVGPTSPSQRVKSGWSAMRSTPI